MTAWLLIVFYAVLATGLLSIAFATLAFLHNKQN